MKYTFPVFLALACSLVVQTAMSAQPQPTLFRYKNEQGTLVTTTVLPPEAADKGYEIITLQGDVLKRVAPAPTPDERKALLAKMQNDVEQEKYDKALVLKYGSLAELLKAQKRMGDDDAAKMSLLTNNLNNINSQIEVQQKRAADFERQGKQVPEAILKTLDALYASRETTEDAIRLKEKETGEQKARFDYEINRYKQLKGLK